MLKPLINYNYMPSKKQPEPSKKPDALVKEKSDFKETLLKRIEIGHDLINRTVTNTEELEQNKQDYYRWDSYNSEFLKQSFNNEENEYKVSYDRVNSGFILTSSARTPSEKLQELKQDINNKVKYLQQLVEQAELMKSDIEPNSPKRMLTVPITAEDKNVFIVHGHNDEMKIDVARTIEKLGLTPIILHERPNEGKTLIEKFESHSAVGFAIVLLTDDDEGKSKNEVELRKRARQNVVLELGYFIGKLSRSRVLPLYSEGVDLPSDINGLLYTQLDNSGNWKFAIVRELKAAGYAVDANKLL
jgi:predicted nucleotide-binding protein